MQRGRARGRGLPQRDVGALYTGRQCRRGAGERLRGPYTSRDGTRLFSMSWGPGRVQNEARARQHHPGGKRRDSSTVRFELTREGPRVARERPQVSRHYAFNLAGCRLGCEQTMLKPLGKLKCAYTYKDRMMYRLAGSSLETIFFKNNRIQTSTKRSPCKRRGGVVVGSYASAPSPSRVTHTPLSYGDGRGECLDWRDEMRRDVP